MFVGFLESDRFVRVTDIQNLPAVIPCLFIWGDYAIGFITCIVRLQHELRSVDLSQGHGLHRAQAVRTQEQHTKERNTLASLQKLG